jgi:hypothetical protein
VIENFKNKMKNHSEPEENCRLWFVAKLATTSWIYLQIIVHLK